MPINNLTLRKALRILYSPRAQQISLLRAEIRTSLQESEGRESGGGDFFGPFWADAKRHVFSEADLHQLVAQRIDRNPRRRRLYPLLRDGFLTWWNDRRRWTNAPFREGQQLRGRLSLDAIDTTLRMDNLLTVQDSRSDERAIYPYFSEEPALSEEAARVGLWAMTEAFPNVEAREFRILDVLRGETSSFNRAQMIGDEREVLQRRFSELLRLYEDLLPEYQG